MLPNSSMKSSIFSLGHRGKRGEGGRVGGVGEGR